jgi:hypothetical protein
MKNEKKGRFLEFFLHTMYQISFLAIREMRLTKQAGSGDWDGRWKIADQSFSSDEQCAG